MSLTAEQIALVQTSFGQIKLQAADVARIFYARLFEIAPEVRPLFRNNMDEQGLKLMQVLSFAVLSLKDLPSVVPAVQALGERHVKYGVQPEHYTKVGEALLWTLAKGLGEAFTPEVAAAWTAVYTLLAKTAMGDLYLQPQS